MKTLAKSLLFISLNYFISTASATSAGMYLGISLGAAQNKADQVHVPSTPPQTTLVATPKKTQFGSRLLIGYQINPYVGIEGGFTYLSAIKFDTPTGTTACDGLTARAKVFDIVGKLELPIEQASLFVKGGAAITLSSTSNALNSTTVTSSDACGEKQHNQSIRPTFSAGVSYAFSPTVITDLTWTRIMMDKPIKQENFISIGLTYHFVDRYCGQFLCDE